MTQRRQTSQPRPVAKPEPNSIQLEDLPLRPELIGAEPYGAPQLDVPVCLNVNENPYPPSEAVRKDMAKACLLYTSPSPRDRTRSRMPSSA